MGTAFQIHNIGESFICLPPSPHFLEAHTGCKVEDTEPTLAQYYILRRAQLLYFDNDKRQRIV